jgi:hypothetical protein
MESWSVTTLEAFGAFGSGRLRRAAELDRFLEGHLEHVVDAFAVRADLQRVRLVAAAIALGTGDEEIAEELHLDLFIAGAPAAFAAAFAGVEGEKARRDAQRAAVLAVGKERAQGDRRHRHKRRVCCAACGPAATDRPCTTSLQLLMAVIERTRPGFVLADLAAQALEIAVEHLVHERAFAGAGDARDAAEDAERDVHIEVLQVVLAGADACAAGAWRSWRLRRLAEKPFFERGPAFLRWPWGWRPRNSTIETGGRRFSGSGMVLLSGQVVGGERGLALARPARGPL